MNSFRLPWSYPSPIINIKIKDGKKTLPLRFPRPFRRHTLNIRAITTTVLIILLTFVAYRHSQSLRLANIPIHMPEHQQQPLLSSMSQQAPRLFIGIKSSPLEKYRKRRDMWRKSACPKRYRDAGVQYRFFVGRPLLPGNDRTAHRQGTKDPLKMREAERSLHEESDKFGDISVLAIRDAYMDISHKLLGILNYGFLRTKARYILRHDDEYCVNLTVALGIIDAHETGDMSGSELYAGTYMFRGDEYEAMKGAEGEIAPFMSGWCTIFSRGLLKYILETDWTHTVLFATYGTSSEDANSGKWVKYAQDKHGLRVDIRSKGMVEDVEKMVNSSNRDGGHGSAGTVTAREHPNKQEGK